MAVAARLAGAEISGIYNLGTGEARSFLDLIDALGAACGVAPKIEFVDMPDAIRPNYQYFTQANMSRLRQAGYNAPVHAARRRRPRLRDAAPRTARPVSCEPLSARGRGCLRP